MKGNISMGAQYDSGLFSEDDLAKIYNKAFTDGQKATLQFVEKELSNAVGERATIQDVVKFLRERDREFKEFLERK